MPTRLVAVIPDGAWRKPIRIAFDGDPVPDVSVIRGAPLDYRDHHPTPDDVALLVEVAVSSVDNDLGEKALLYAQAGIGDYWVVLPETAQTCRPSGPNAGGLCCRDEARPGRTLSPLAASDVTLAVADLLGPPQTSST